MSQIKKLTSFMKLSTGEGDRIAFTYSIIDTDGGKVLSQNEKENFLGFGIGYYSNSDFWLSDDAGFGCCSEV